MNARKRNSVLIAFGALAAVLIAAFLVMRPTFPKDEASGAIGTVHKLHKTQITQKDVVLVDDATKREEDVIYGDFLSDSSKLESISAELGSALQNRGDLQASMASRSIPQTRTSATSC